MAITAGLVKELRERTGAGMLDCKKALEQTDANMDKAIEFLREKGLAQAAKKAGRIAAEGLVGMKLDDAGQVAAIVEVNSETDFVAKNDIFKNFVSEVVTQALASNSTDIDAFLNEAWILTPDKSVNDALTEKIAVLGEKMTIRRFDKVQATDGFVETYIHGGGRIGVVIEFASNVVNNEIRECAKNLAMQIAAISPKYVSRDEISPEFIEKEREIVKQLSINENPDKPESIIEKMMIGRLNKSLKEMCLVDQAYVKDSDMTVTQYVASVAKANNATISVKKFVRFETGEGIEKRVDNFAEEVAKQMQQ